MILWAIRTEAVRICSGTPGNACHRLATRERRFTEPPIPIPRYFLTRDQALREELLEPKEWSSSFQLGPLEQAGSGILLPVLGDETGAGALGRF